MLELTNYRKEKLTIDLGWANIFGVLILIPIVLGFGLPYYLIWSPELSVKAYLNTVGSLGVILRMLVMILTLMVGIVLHELIHGITWGIVAKNGFKSIKFGVLWNMLTPYCHCKEPMTVRHYILGAITPAIVLGFIPSILALVIGNLVLLVFGMIFTAAASGDFLIINLIRKENHEDLVQDHPSEAGCYIYRIIETQ
ncbi:MAG: DUF3267 domain-containing protein [Candidatus Delongbacteria bacterium]|nr:DUF3267 domain-containing protein [Candidatus Delongbacteria bacterium]